MNEIWLLIGKDARGNILSIEAFKEIPTPHKNAYDDDIIFFEIRSVKVYD